MIAMLWSCINCRIVSIKYLILIINLNKMLYTFTTKIILIRINLIIDHYIFYEFLSMLKMCLEFKQIILNLSPHQGF